MRHFFFIDPIEKLNIKKDSTLMLAANLKVKGEEVYFLFEEDLCLVTHARDLKLFVYDFDPVFQEDYDRFKGRVFLENLLLTSKREIILNSHIDIFHMRLDPPFDSRYLRYLWMLKFFKDKKLKIINNPEGILKYNEKLWAYTQPSSIETYVGASSDGFLKFLYSLNLKNQEVILKPLDLYQGMGVEKINFSHRSAEDLKNIFLKKVADCGGPIVAQPFISEVAKGEVRAIYFKGYELGSILKVPKEGEFLANIAQGASFRPIELKTSVKNECEHITKHLLAEGVLWVAFDILGDRVSEINITCPGLLVEVSRAHGQNFVTRMQELGF